MGNGSGGKLIGSGYPWRVAFKTQGGAVCVILAKRDENAEAMGNARICFKASYRTVMKPL